VPPASKKKRPRDGRSNDGVMYGAVYTRCYRVALSTCPVRAVLCAVCRAKAWSPLNATRATYATNAGKYATNAKDAANATTKKQG